MREQARPQTFHQVCDASGLDVYQCLSLSPVLSVKFHTISPPQDILPHNITKLTVRYPTISLFHNMGAELIRYVFGFGALILVLYIIAVIVDAWPQLKNTYTATRLFLQQSPTRCRLFLQQSLTRSRLFLEAWYNRFRQFLIDFYIVSLLHTGIAINLCWLFFEDVARISLRWIFGSIHQSIRLVLTAVGHTISFLYLLSRAKVIASWLCVSKSIAQYRLKLQNALRPYILFFTDLTREPTTWLRNKTTALWTRLPHTITQLLTSIYIRAQTYHLRVTTALTHYTPTRLTHTLRKTGAFISTYRKHILISVVILIDPFRTPLRLLARKTLYLIPSLPRLLSNLLFSLILLFSHFVATILRTIDDTLDFALRPLTAILAVYILVPYVWRWLAELVDEDDLPEVGGRELQVQNMYEKGEEGEKDPSRVTSQGEGSEMGVTGDRAEWTPKEEQGTDVGRTDAVMGEKALVLWKGDGER
ncbi:hypothetical protein M011DRAFT_70112 [Sporormia fimetaria CBS 119925]|uniref:Uncharacterized protein n=1 Tax=Sporormia fimetaria CBS 119925 TaxID=1340428 RepID=A0A6A6VCQ4_9PLEO|nr:hypothetical protein M011DRAFT_70112 [Sporormia fimetaria CBS 119925]